MTISDVVNTANALVEYVPLLGGSTLEKDYQDALSLADSLMDTDPSSPLLTMLIEKIEAYENTAPEFDAFNETIKNTPTGIAVLRVLMDQYGLNQSEFENEIGKRSQVSRVLKGDRALTVEAIKRLSERFGLPPQMFIE